MSRVGHGHQQHPRDVETTRLELKPYRGSIRSRACITCALPIIVLFGLAMISVALAFIT